MYVNDIFLQENNVGMMKLDKPQLLEVTFLNKFWENKVSFMYLRKLNLAFKIYNERFDWKTHFLL
jgi:hypothetical protein